MILAIDAVGAKHGGAATVLTAVVAAALRGPGVERVVVFGSPRRMRRFALPDDARLRDVEIELGEAGPPGRIAWQEAGLARAVARQGAGLLICLSGGGHAGRGCATVNLVQQSLPFLPEALLTLPARQRVRMAVLRMAMHRSCRRARLVVVQTATMRSAVASAFGIPQNRIAVVEPVPEPVAPTSGAPELACMRSAPPGRRLLYVGNDSPYKNLAVLEAALPALRERFPDLRLFATLPEGHPLVRVAGVERLGYLRPDVLAEAYELATALVLPSLAETVGLPMLEAAMAGAPVLAADRPYAREVCPAGSLFFDPLRADDLVEATTRLVSSQTLRAELGAAGRALLARRGAVRPYDRLIELCLQAALAAPETPLRVV